MTEEPEVTTISEKGQVVIPQSIRKQLKIKPKNKFLVYGKDDTIILKAGVSRNKKRTGQNLRSQVQKQLNISEEEIQEIASEFRKERYSK